MFTSVKNTIYFLRFHFVHARSLGAIRRWQGRHLEKLVARLNKHVTLYRELLRAHGIDIASIRSLDDLARLPIVTKADYMNRYAEEYTDRGDPARAIWTMTPGVSAPPFAVLKGAQSTVPLYADSLNYRFLFWDRPMRFNIDDVRIAYVRTRQHERPNRFLVTIDELRDNSAQATKALAQFAPQVVETFPSLLEKLVEASEKYQIPIQARYVISTGEVLTVAVRSRLEKGLSCEVYDRYGLEEFGAVAVECRMHNGMHVNAETFIVEVVDEVGAPVQSQKEGRILVTDLFNLRMPFVRYDTGDRGFVSYEACECGLESPRVWISKSRDGFTTSH